MWCQSTGRCRRRTSAAAVSASASVLCNFFTQLVNRQHSLHPLANLCSASDRPCAVLALISVTWVVLVLFLSPREQLRTRFLGGDSKDVLILYRTSAQYPDPIGILQLLCLRVHPPMTPQVGYLCTTPIHTYRGGGEAAENTNKTNAPKDNTFRAPFQLVGKRES